jgi:hypothetical protein
MFFFEYRLWQNTDMFPSKLRDTGLKRSIYWRNLGCGVKYMEDGWVGPGWAEVYGRWRRGPWIFLYLHILSCECENKYKTETYVRIKIWLQTHVHIKKLQNFGVGFSQPIFHTKYILYM